jgi:peptide chain release factor 1
MRGDPELRELADEEIASRDRALQQLDGELLACNWSRRTRATSGGLYLEVRAGTGGDEAAIFAGDLFRMYARYAERRAGGSKWNRPAPANTAATRKSSPASKAMAPIRS